MYVKVAKKKGELSCGYGFVTYDTPYSAAVAILNMNGLHVGQNKRLKVSCLVVLKSCNCSCIGFK